MKRIQGEFIKTLTQDTVTQSLLFTVGEGDCFSLILKRDQYRCQICVYGERILQADPKMDRRSFPLQQVVPEEKRMQVDNQYHKSLLHIDFPNLTSTSPLPSMFFLGKISQDNEKKASDNYKQTTQWDFFPSCITINCSLERMIEFEMPYC